MAVVYARENEPFEVLLRNFKKKCEIASILSDIKKYQHYEKPSVERRRKTNAVKRKMLNNQRKLVRYGRYSR